MEDYFNNQLIEEIKTDIKKMKTQRRRQAFNMIKLILVYVLFFYIADSVFKSAWYWTVLQSLGLFIVSANVILGIYYFYWKHEKKANR